MKIIVPMHLELLWPRAPKLWETVRYIYSFVLANYEPDRPFILKKNEESKSANRATPNHGQPWKISTVRITRRGAAYHMNP